MATTMQKTVLLIAGVKDNGCRESVIHALERIPGVREVEVNFCHARAVVRHDEECAAEELTRAVSEAGFGAETGV